MNLKRGKIRIVLGTLIFLGCGTFIYYSSSIFSKDIKYVSSSTDVKSVNFDKSNTEVPLKKEEQKSIKPVPITHIETPKTVRAIYVTNWVAGTKKFKSYLVKMIDETELNSIVIDIKDSTGRIGFEIPNKEIEDLGSIQKRVSNIRELTNYLHKKGIYIIGRISVFQDPYMTKIKPEWAIDRKSNGEVWKNKKGLSFLDPSKRDVYKYILAIAKGAYDQGFDEINFDYIRYPSDGNLSDIDYHLSEGKTRADNVEKFFKYISTEIKKDNNIPISADLFGLTTEASDDMGIGQLWEKALPYFDYLCPMVYPSHYASGYAGYKNPSNYPYEVVYKSINGAIKKTTAMNMDVHKIRPWLQDFNLGAVYTKDMVQAQMKALYDLKLSSWMLWDPKNDYTPSALKLENN